jgi:hypothetical protein
MRTPIDTAASIPAVWDAVQATFSSDAKILCDDSFGFALHCVGLFIPAWIVLTDEKATDFVLSALHKKQIAGMIADLITEDETEKIKKQDPKFIRWAEGFMLALDKSMMRILKCSIYFSVHSKEWDDKLLYFCMLHVFKKFTEAEFKEIKHLVRTRCIVYHHINKVLTINDRTMLWALPLKAGPPSKEVTSMKERIKINEREEKRTGKEPADAPADAPAASRKGKEPADAPAASGKGQEVALVSSKRPRPEEPGSAGGGSSKQQKTATAQQKSNGDDSMTVGLPNARTTRDVLKTSVWALLQKVSANLGVDSLQTSLRNLTSEAMQKRAEERGPAGGKS